MPSVAFLSFRLGLGDGVSVVAGTWERWFAAQGWDTRRVAGEGPVDQVVPGLELSATSPPDADRLARALDGADLVVAENILTIPMNLDASRVVARVLAGRPTLVHHHDPPWQRSRFAHVTELPVDDPAWRHVTINRLTEGQFAERGLAATTIYNGFDVDVEPGDRTAVRDMLGVGPDTVLVLHPVRAIERKNIPVAMAVTAAVDGVYWLPGPAEEDYAPTLDRLLTRARGPVVRTPLDRLGPGRTMADLYAASDLVVFPSTWEGFGNPPLEAAIHGRPVVVGSYPVGRELRDLGFWWLDPDDIPAVRAAVAEPPAAELARNRDLVRRHCSLEVMGRGVESLLKRAGWWG